MSKDDVNIAVTRFGQVSNKEPTQEDIGLCLPLSIGLVESQGATLEISSAPHERTLIIIPLCEDDVARNGRDLVLRLFHDRRGLVCAELIKPRRNFLIPQG